MEIRYIDVHCHLQFPPYDADRDECIAAMRARGIAGIVVGVDRASSEEAVALARKHEHIYASVGLHPNYISRERFEIEAYEALARDPRVVAIGECGLDYFRPNALTAEVVHEQKQVLKNHVAVARRVGKPLIIHARPSRKTQDAYQDLIALLAEAKHEEPALSGDIHFFVGGSSEAKHLISLGFSVSFTAVITFARDYDDTMRAVPLSSILAETDAPYVAPASRRGERNDSFAVEEVVAEIARIRGEDTEDVRRAIMENAKRLFSIPR